MSAHQLVRDLLARGVELTLVEGHIHWKGPQRRHDGSGYRAIAGVESRKFRVPWAGALQRLRIGASFLKNAPPSSNSTAASTDRKPKGARLNAASSIG